MIISKWQLEKAMFSKGYDFKRLSSACGVSRTTLSAIRNGKSCKPVILLKIAQALEVEPEILLEA